MKKRVIAFLLVFAIGLLSACSISKAKDLSKYPNLLLGTNNGTENYKLMDNGYDATLESDGDGVKVIMTSHDDSGWLVLFYNDGQSQNCLAGNEGDTYTIAFEAKANIKDAEIRVSHKKGDSKASQIDFGTANLNKADKWTQVILTGTLSGVEASSQGVYFDLRHNPAGTEISIRNLKLIKGTV